MARVSEGDRYWSYDIVKMVLEYDEFSYHYIAGCKIESI